MAIYLETFAKTGKNVDQAFILLTEKIIEKKPDQKNSSR